MDQEKRILSEIDSLITASRSYFLADEAKWQDLLNEALLLAKENNLWDKFISIHRYHQLTNYIYYNKIRLWKQELVFIDSIIQNRKSFLEGKVEILAMDMKTQWAIYYARLGNHHQGINLVKEAIFELQQLPLDSANAYNLHYYSSWLARFYRDIRSYESSIQENYRELQFLDQEKEFLSNSNQSKDRAGAYAAIAYSYLLQEKFSQSLKYYHKAELELNQFLLNPTNAVETRTLFLNIYSGFARFHRANEDYDQSLAYFKKIQAFVRKNDPFYAKNLANIGNIHLTRQNYDLAFQAYIEAEKILSERYGNKNFILATVNFNLARLFKEQKQWKKALPYYQKAISNVLLDFNDTLDYWKNPIQLNPDKIIGYSHLVKALHGKSEVMSELYKATEDTRYLENAQEANNLSVELIDLIKANQFLDKDRQLQIEDHFQVYENGIDIAERLYRANQDERQIETLFKLAEKSKSLSLLAVFNPDLNEKGTTSLQERERQLKYEIARRQEWLVKKRRSLNEDSTYLALQNSYNDWLFKIQKEHPEYLELKNKTQVLPIAEIQQKLLKPTQAMLEFFWGERDLFTLLITPSGVRVFRQPVGTLADSIYQLRELSLDPGWGTDIEQTIAFQNLSHAIYQRVLERPLAALSDQVKELVIVRDGPLVFIPFELLDVSSQTHPGIFATQDFLLSHYTLAYANSATLLNYQKQYEGGKARNNFAGYAPTYQEALDSLDNPPIAYLTRSGLYELKSTKEEVETIAGLLNGEFYTDFQATERHFKTHAPDYKILHLAMHAIPDPNQPEFSELVFAMPNPDTSEDGHLRAIELYNMRLNADVVVLSACATGFGKFLSGEGIMSLGHAFAYSGVPSLVVSLWDADDRTTAMVMTYFYQNLKEGMSKDQALTQAKLKFLEDYPEFAHPYYWATFIGLGDMSAIALDGSYLSRYIWFGVAFLLLLVGLYFLKRNSAG